MRVGSRYLESRKLALFVGEQLALFASFVVATLSVSHALGQHADWFRILTEAAVVTTALQIGLYLADLYDFGVSRIAAAHFAIRGIGLAPTCVAGHDALDALQLPIDAVEAPEAAAAEGGYLTLSCD